MYEIDHIIEGYGEEMENLIIYELLARQKYEEDLKFAEDQRIKRSAGDSFPSIWNRFVEWAMAGRQGGHKPARA